MHHIQSSLLKLIDAGEIDKMTLRAIGQKIGISHPQKIKHHFQQLEKKGLIYIDQDTGMISRRSIAEASRDSGLFLNLPILGTANCGPASFFADDNCQGLLKISKGLLPKNGEFFVVKADGESMNRANIDGKTINSGDYVVVDRSEQTPSKGDYILGVFENTANIKKFDLDLENECIVLKSESSMKFDPIYLAKSDLDDFFVSGIVVKVIKN